MELSHNVACCPMLQDKLLSLHRKGQTCGGLMTAAKESTLNMPRLEMVKVPPLISSGPSLPSLAYMQHAPSNSIGGFQRYTSLSHLLESCR